MSRHVVIRTTRSAYWLCLPAIGVLAAVAGWPLARTLYFSFTDARLGTMDGARWVGLANFITLVQDPDWWGAVKNTLWFAGFSVFLETLLGLAVAMLLNSRIRGRGLLRSAVLIPWAIPAVVSARIWAWMFNDLYGFINDWLLRLKLIADPVAWLAEDRLALAVLVGVDVWKTTPFMALLLLAGLQSIPRSVYEAASVDGAGRARVFFHVTLPLLRPALAVAILFRTLDALRVFDLPYVLTSNSRETAVMSVFARQQLIEFQDVGYGSAAAVFVFLGVAGVAAIHLRVTGGIPGQAGLGSPR